jgi:hypothetical protein
MCPLKNSVQHKQLRISVGTGVPVVPDHYVGYMSCISHAGAVHHIAHRDRNKLDEYNFVLQFSLLYENI